MVNQTQIIELEEKFWQAMKENDVDTAVSLTRFPCLISGPKGSRLVNEDDFRQMMSGHDGKDYADLKVTNNMVEILNEETAVITYQSSLKGKTFIDASTWINENGNWLCAFHSENPLVQ